MEIPALNKPNTDLPTAYTPRDAEEAVHSFWQGRAIGGSAPDSREPYAIVIPPPNITGALHMGHALNNTLQDVIIRWARMTGYNACWVPGCDHGGIATQNVVERLLQKEQRKHRHDLGRDGFLEFMWDWRRKTGDTILMQLRRIGCSCDWERTRFTMDETCSAAVYRAFITLYEQGLIYRGNRIVNWCPRCRTALADIEVEYRENKGSLWHLRYPLKQPVGSRTHIVVATTRPETMLGDTAVAVNPSDERYAGLVGATLILPLLNREIPIVADELVDAGFGTGAVKVTPAHDPVDFQIAQNHRLPFLKVIDDDGRMQDVGPYSGLDRFECRTRVVADLETRGLLEKTEPYRHNVGACYRCATVIEPTTSDQWFVRMEGLAQRAADAIAAGRVRYHPENWKDNTLAWLANIKDWCISRQIWWGHRIPVWYCDAGRRKAEASRGADPGCPPIASAGRPERCPACGCAELTQDPDVLDTWFSSALWPFSVFGWGVNPDRRTNRDLAYYYPTKVLVTGYEILYLWVARMIMMGLHFLDEVPFGDVYVHGIVRDAHGKKMSKSLGNVIDPLEKTAAYGTDALRFALAHSAMAGKDLHLTEEHFVSARNFMNKLYNMTRFVRMNLPERAGNNTDTIARERNRLTIADEWILGRLSEVSAGITEAFRGYLIGTAARTLHDCTWFSFCDWYLEAAKLAMADTPEQRRVSSAVLMHVLENILKLLHPFAPFITEHLWRSLAGLLDDASESLAEARLPERLPFPADAANAGLFESLIRIVSELRSLRNEFRLPQNTRPDVTLSLSPAMAEQLKRYEQWILRLAQAGSLRFGDKAARSAAGVITLHDGSAAEVSLALEGLVDAGRERERLSRELAEVTRYLAGMETRLADERFTSRAPAEEVDKLRGKHTAALARKLRLDQRLRELESFSSESR